MKILRQIGWGRALCLLLLVWLVFLLFTIGYLRHEPDTQVAQRLSEALKELDSLHKKHTELNNLVLEYYIGDAQLKPEDKALLHKNLEKVIGTNIQVGYPPVQNAVGQPSTEYEALKRKLHSGILEFWWFVSSEVKKIRKEAENFSPLLASKFNNILDLGIEHKRSLIKDVSGLNHADGYASWRQNEFEELSSLIQRRLDYLQNPSDCSKAKKLVCNLNKGCGFGCQLHHVIYCFIMAYGLERTLILKSKGWRYGVSGWESVFFPLSRTCTSANGSSHGPWRANGNVQVMNLPIIDSLTPRSKFLPGAVPNDIAGRLTRIHGNPTVWWIGQFLKYMLKYQPATKQMLDDFGRKVNFQNPIVGVHIRRTDKVGTEAAFHSVEEYMSHVEEYFQQLLVSQPVPQKRIYLATDDPKVFTEIRQKYPEYEVLGDAVISKSASLGNRYSRSSLDGIITDIHFLARTDFLVCTFSSQVCRIAYEIMNALVPDAADHFKSLDDVYYFGGQEPHYHVAVLPHTAKTPQEMNLKVGDILTIAGNHWDGYSKGSNLRSQVYASLFPSFKVQPKVETADFPTYPQVPLKAPESEPVR
ncbi:unnamed protein product [Bemisia tabaci]|uniref:Alpha-(1,6)-fucosyltransferase n=1 Tax=Bemisia tabaci TaxID=7038 RepID=A0A9P0F3A0_BEMTA|nr:PREDICTED: alpha-(1,6)-fucosyltransferase [Bemisia tabaci]CAH0387109.1 unnamed protein product [Bemisia tabaci]